MSLVSSVLKHLGLGGAAGVASTPAGSSPDSAGLDVADAEAHATAVAIARHALQERNFSLAVERFRDAIDIRHDDAESYCDMGIAYMKQQQNEEAADCFHMAAHFREDFARPHYFLARLANSRGDETAAVAHLQRAIALKPEFAEAHNLLGSCLWALGDAERAVTAFSRAVELQPQCALFHSNLGYVLMRGLEEFERGAVHIEKALQIDAADTSILCNYSLVLSYRNRTEEAIALCDRILADEPEHHVARLNRALAKLKLQNFSQAWPDYEARRHAGINYVPRPFAFSQWAGESLTGKTLLIYGEQGVGDEIMFASCLPDVLHLGGRCIVDCSPRLAALFSRSFPDAIVHGANQADRNIDWLHDRGTVDCQIGVGSLPGFFRRRSEDFPNHGGYLRADPVRVEHWKTRLQLPERPLKVGIAWRGGMRSTRRSLRSLELGELLPLLRTPGIRFVSLQHDATAEELASVGDGGEIMLDHWPEAVADLDETAALIAALDLVVTVCSTPVHLSGALGQRAWALVPASADWRYLERGEQIPWYPGVRMFRQAPAGDWTSVIDAVGRELAGLRAE